MFVILPKPPGYPERLLVIICNSILVLGAHGSFLFTFVPSLLWDSPSHAIKETPILLANALFYIGLTSALILYLNVAIHIKKATSMALFLYHATVSWMLIRVVFLERKTFDSAVSAMASHIIATVLFAFALYRTRNVTNWTRVNNSYRTSEGSLTSFFWRANSFCLNSFRSLCYLVILYIHYNTRMSTIVPKPPNPERLINLALGYHSILIICGSFLFTFLLNLVWANPTHGVKQTSILLANALFFISLTPALALYLNVPLRIKRTMSMALLVYHVIPSWFWIRMVFVERKRFDSAVLAIAAHILAIILFAYALYRTQNVTHLTRVAEKISAKIPDVGTAPQKEA